MTSPDIVVLVCVILIMLAFVVRAVISRISIAIDTEADRYDQYLFASQRLSGADVAKSTAATYTAFATVFFWFVTLGAIYGWLLYLIPMCLLFGNWLFTRYVRRFQLNIPRLRTIASLVRSQTTFGPLWFVADFIVLVFLGSAILVEIVIGSTILNSLIPNVPGGPLFFVVLLTGLVLVYVVVGGFRAVVLSDVMQLYMAVVGILALLVFALFLLKGSFTSADLFRSPEATPHLIWAFVASVLAVQLFGPPCMLQNWQRIASARDESKALRGHWVGALLGAVLWTLMILCALVLSAKLGKNQIDFANVFSQMKQGGMIAAYALYPLVFIAFVSTLISTADSALAGLYLAVYDRFRGARVQDERTFEPTWKHHVSVAVIFAAIVLLVYFVARGDLLNVAFSLIYFLFNQLIVLFPMVMYLIICQGLKLKIQRRGIEVNWLIATSAGWFAVAAMSIVGYQKGSLPWMMYASAAGVGVATVLSAPSWYLLLKRRLPSAVEG